jgi:hypothetical protein
MLKRTYPKQLKVFLMFKWGLFLLKFPIKENHVFYEWKVPQLSNIYIYIFIYFYFIFIFCIFIPIGFLIKHLGQN